MMVRVVLIRAQQMSNALKKFEFRVVDGALLNITATMTCVSIKQLNFGESP